MPLRVNGPSTGFVHSQGRSLVLLDNDVIAVGDNVAHLLLDRAASWMTVAPDSAGRRPRCGDAETAVICAPAATVSEQDPPPGWQGTLAPQACHMSHSC